MVRDNLISHIVAAKSRAIVIVGWPSFVANVHLKKFASLTTIRVRFARPEMPGRLALR